MYAPRVLIAGTHSGVGKTTITTGIMGAIANRGHRVNPFKVGPDYIDPSYHQVAAGRPGRNLDCWMVEPPLVYELFCHTAQKGGINVIEGVMGLFDGASSISDEGSTAQVAKLTKTPVILIVDVRSSARSAAAVVLGFQKFDPELQIAGVILNRVGSERHLGLVSEAIEKYCDIPVIGFIKKNAKLELPSRHLGLIPTGEGRELPEKVAELASIIEEGISIEKLVSIAESAPDLKEPFPQALFQNGQLQGSEETVKIGIARDEAFSFYYQDGLEILEHMGARLIPFSPIHDRELPPDVQGVYIGGGYPEIYLNELSQNASMLKAIRIFGEAGYPVLGECGGLMYLSEGIYNVSGEFYKMAGLVPGRTVMKNKLVSLGYVTATCARDTILGPKGTIMRGHEFHYSDIEPRDMEGYHSFHLLKNRTREELITGYARGNILASYLHLHFAANIDTAKNFVDMCRQGGRHND